MDKGSGLLHRLPGKEEDKGTRCLGLDLLSVKEDKGSDLLHRLPGEEDKGAGLIHRLPGKEENGPGQPR